MNDLQPQQGSLAEKRQRQRTVVMNLMHDANNKIALAGARLQLLKRKLAPEFDEEEIKDLDLAIDAVKELHKPLDVYYTRCKEEGFI